MTPTEDQQTLEALRLVVSMHAAAVNELTGIMETERRVRAKMVELRESVLDAMIPSVGQAKINFLKDDLVSREVEAGIWPL